MHAGKQLSHLSIASVCKQWNIMYDGKNVKMPELENSDPLPRGKFLQCFDTIG